jgi:twitching motility protein PilJ
MSNNTGDLVSKIVEANALENEGKTEQAIALYKQIVELDTAGNYGDVAREALNNLQSEITTVIQPASAKPAVSEIEPKLNQSDDLVGKIIEANNLENEGKTEQAIALYREIVESDRDGNYGNVAQQALDSLQETTTEEKTIRPTRSSSWLERLSIRNKATLILTGLTLVSTIGLSIVAYTLADKTIINRFNQIQQAASSSLTQKIAFFMRERYGDIQVMAGLPLFSDSELRTNSSDRQKQSLLDSYVEAYGLYNSVAAFDLNGNVIAQSTGDTLGNQRDRSYFQAALESDRAFISQPIISKSTGIRAIYLVAPIKDSQSDRTIGVMTARMPVEKLQDLVTTGESQEAYILDAQGDIFVSSDSEDREKIIAAAEGTIPTSASFDFYSQLSRELDRRLDNREMQALGKQKRTQGLQAVFDGEKEVAYFNTFADIDAEFLSDFIDLGWSTVLTIDRQAAFATQKQLLQVFVMGNLIVTLAMLVIARLIARRATEPVVEAADALNKIGQGDLDVRLKVEGQDELADLRSNLNKMAAQIADLFATYEAEAQRQRQEKDILQQGVMGLLLDVEGAQKGDLTVKAAMSEGVIGSVADAFNTTIAKLRELLQQVKSVSTEVGQLSLSGEQSVRQLSESAISQTEEIVRTLSSIDKINQSVETVANYAQEAAKIARQGSIQAKEGDLAMDATVDSIEKIRGTVANTSKKVKQLAESSQEIAQIVEIISGISEKTNLLAFNASVEAARAGEHGEGFRIVAEEVRRLADRTTDATKDIQQLVTTIQQDTTSVLQSMESSTSEVVNGSELVRMTKANLRSLAQTSQQIDEYLNYISTSTVEQTNSSQLVDEQICGLATLAQTNTAEAQSVVQSLKTLVAEAQNLLSSVSQFKLESDYQDVVEK